MTILILHGIGGYAGIHWQQWLCDELIKEGHKVIMPDLPGGEHPDRKTWLKTVEETIKNVDLSDLVIVAHSLSVATSLDLVEQVKIRAFVSVSGFSNDYGADMNSYFLKEKIIDFNKVNNNLGKAFVICSDNDPYVPQAELKSLAVNLNVKPEIIPNGGHLNTAAGFTTFPRLLEIVEKEV